MLEISVLVGILAVIAMIGFHTLTTGISPVPTSPRVRAALLALLPPGLDGVIIEAGSGWGGLAFALAKRYPGARVHAFELSWVPWAVSRLRLAITPLANLTIKRGDFMGHSLTDARAVVCYLFPGGMEKLKAKFEAELASGALVASNTFAIRGWKAERVIQADDLYASPVYLYRMPPQPNDVDPPASSGIYFGLNP